MFEEAEEDYDDEDYEDDDDEDDDEDYFHEEPTVLIRKMPRICGPKLSNCCFVLSIWGIIMLVSVCSRANH